MMHRISKLRAKVATKLGKRKPPARKVVAGKAATIAKYSKSAEYQKAL